MLETFAASCNFKSLLQQHDDMPAVHKYLTVMEHATKDRACDALAGMFKSGHHSQKLPSHANRARSQDLSDRAMVSLNRKFELSDTQVCPSFISYSDYTIGKVRFATRSTNKGDSNILFRTGTGGAVPGIIQFIISLTTEQSGSEIFFIIERHAKYTVGADPFASHETFGAGIWSSKMEVALEVVHLSAIISHSISRPWSNGLLVFGTLDRVSVFYSFTLYADRHNLIEPLSVIHPMFCRLLCTTISTPLSGV